VGESKVRLALFLAGIATIVAALLSPIDRLGEQLFLMHMTQHLLLLDIAPILIILSLSKKLLRPVTRRTVSVEKRAGWFGTPTFAITLYVLTMWIWHIPLLYDGALENDYVHVLEHFAFSIAGGLYWWHIFSPVRPRHRLIGLGAAGYMASTKVLVGLLGVFLTFSSDSFYAFYERQPQYWGLTPSEDQAIGGAIMALEQMIVMGAAFAWLFIRMLTEADRDNARTERYAPASGEPVVPRVRGPLGSREAREDLGRLGVTLRDGMRVTLVSDAGDEDVVARWDAEWGGWAADPLREPAARG
jgi:cytochrome c oxidase assembly factor CtaG